MILKHLSSRMPSTRRAVCFVIAIAGSLVVATSSALASSTPAPIEGTWFFQNGQVSVQQTGTNTFQGTVVSPTSFTGCTHPVGQVIWQIQGSGTSYTGTHVWFKSGCEPNPGGQSTWKIVDTSPTQYTLTFCTASPGSGPPNPSATPSNPVGSTLCYDLTRNLAPGQVSTATLLGAPSISGTPKVGNTLACSPGSWNNNPTGYGYGWDRNGSPIANATNQTYIVVKADEGLTLTCVVTAFNLGGGSNPASSAGVDVPVPSISGCPAATGKLSGRTLGPVRLDMTRAGARHAFAHSSVKHRGYTDAFCLTPSGVTVGYAPSRLVSVLPGDVAKSTSGRVVLVTTANAFYAVHGIRPGMTFAAAAHKLRLRSPIRTGGNTWYVVPNGVASAVVEVHRGTVDQIGIADSRLTEGQSERSRLVKSFF